MNDTTPPFTAPRRTRPRPQPGWATFVLCCLVCLRASPLLADATYLWTGDDPRFTGGFSISDADFAAGSFYYLTAIDFEFHDPQHPAYDRVVSTPDSIDVYGVLTADRQHLQHIPNPAYNGAGFWISSYLNTPSTPIMLYTLHDGLIPQERFQYYRPLENVFVDSTGTWSLQSVPEPSSFCLAGLAVGVAAMISARRIGVG